MSRVSVTKQEYLDLLKKADCMEALRNIMFGLDLTIFTYWTLLPKIILTQSIRYIGRELGISRPLDDFNLDIIDDGEK